MSENLLTDRYVSRYLRSLVDRFFKILPMKEENEETLPVYIQSLQAELIGFKELARAIKYDTLYISLLSILQYISDNPECSVTDVRREVFGAISIIYKLRHKYTEGGINNECMVDISEAD